MGCKRGVCFTDIKPEEPGVGGAPGAAMGMIMRRGGIPRDSLPPARPAAPAARPQAPAGAVVAIDPARVKHCVGLYRDLPPQVAEGINASFRGRPRSDAADAEWCDAVESAYYGVAPAAGLANPSRNASSAPTAPVFAVMTRAKQQEVLASRGTAPAGRIIPGLTGTGCQLFGGTPVAGGCNVPDGDGSTPAPTQGGQPVASAEECRSRGGFVMGLEGAQSCSFVNGQNVPIGGGPSGTPEPDHTREIVQGVVGGVVGIAQLVSQVIGRQDQQELTRFMAGLQAERARAEGAARAGDRDAAIALARIQEAIALSNQRAAEANAAAAANNQPPPFQLQNQTPTWVYVAGAGLVAVTVVAVALAVTSARGPRYGEREERRTA